MPPSLTTLRRESEVALGLVAFPNCCGDPAVGQVHMERPSGGGTVLRRHGRVEWGGAVEAATVGDDSEAAESGLPYKKYYPVYPG